MDCERSASFVSEISRVVFALRRAGTGGGSGSATDGTPIRRHPSRRATRASMLEPTNDAVAHSRSRSGPLRREADFATPIRMNFDARMHE